MPGERCMQRQNGCRPLSSATFVSMGLLLLYGPHLARADLSICSDVDAILETTAAVTCYSGNTMVYSALPQNQAVEELYTLTPKAGVTLVSMVAENAVDPFDTYFNLALSDGSAAISVDIIASLEDVVDYSPDGDNAGRTTQLSSSRYTLTYRQDGEDKPLVFEKFQFTITDINNKLPEFEAESYSTTLREDWPVNQEIIDLKVMVRDLDFDPDENTLRVSFDDSCLLNTSTGSDEVVVKDGDYSEITFKLKSKLNYDENNPAVTCILTATDGVNQDSTSIVITVEEGDMPPQFDEVFYKIDVGDESPGVPLTVLPKDIHAEDQGASPTDVTYSMDDAESSISGTEYFEIDATSADVKLIKVLDDEFIKENNQLRFVIYATDELGDQDKAFLEINLPKPVPTTEPETTSGSTSSITTSGRTMTSVIGACTWWWYNKIYCRLLSGTGIAR